MCLCVRACSHTQVPPDFLISAGTCRPHTQKKLLMALYSYQEATQPDHFSEGQRSICNGKDASKANLGVGLHVLSSYQPVTRETERCVVFLRRNWNDVH